MSSRPDDRAASPTDRAGPGPSTTPAVPSSSSGTPPRRPRPDDDETTLIGPGGKVDPEALFDLYSRQDASGNDDAPVTVRFRLARDLRKRLDRYLVDRIPFLSRTALQRLIDEGAVTVNGRPPKASTRLRLGDVVIAVLPPPPSKAIPAEDIPLDVIHEDDDLIVVNKQANLIVHPARGNKSGTLINALAWHFAHRTSGGLSSVGEENARPGVVHRLDRHTTGVMVAAKTDVAHWRLGRQFELRRTDKRYLAVVHGRMEPEADTIELPLGKHRTVREKYAVRWDETGKASTTVYRVREIYDGFTLVELELRTGRTHQIRVHLSHLGYPIVGDDMYGGRHLTQDHVGPSSDSPIDSDAAASDARPVEREDASPLVIGRQALHAATLGFEHPVRRERVQYQAPLPADLRDLISALRAHRLERRVNAPGCTVDLDALLPDSSGAGPDGTSDDPA